MLSLYIIVVAIAYLLGSIPFGYLLVRIFRGEDIRLTGSGNIGATNVARSGAKGLGIATLALDALKGVLAVWIAWLLADRNNLCGVSNEVCVPAFRLASAAALAAIAGHIFPIWLKFKGGKGVATALGVFVLLFPKALLVSLGIFIIAVAVSRYVSLGSILATIAFPVAAYFLGADPLALIPVCAVSIIIVAKHHQNIRRLLAGNENRLGGGSNTPTAEKQA